MARLGAAGAAAAGLPGCSLPLLPMPFAMEQVQDLEACATTRAPVLLVLLPGAFMSPHEMATEGMLRAVRQRRVAADVVAVGSTIEYVFDRSVFDRLDGEVINPARARGYRIWLAGISMGGYLALAYAVTRPGSVEGVMTLAPYLGKRDIVQAVARAPSARAWAAATPPADSPDPVENMDDRLWRWIADPPVGAAQVHLGFGSDDGLAPANRLLARELPPRQVLQAPGGHDWPPWLQLWGRWLDGAPLPRHCA